MTFIYIYQPLRIFFLGLIVLTSAGWAYLGDRCADKWPQNMTITDQIIVLPTYFAAQHAGDRISADILAFMIWFVIQACGLVAVYFAACFAISGPNKKGKDIE